MPPDDVSKLRSFSSSDRFVAEVKAAASSKGPLRPGYVLAGDEIFLYERCRRALVDSLIDPTLREFSLSDLDLAETSIFHVLDLARTPSLMAPFQVLFVKNVKNLYTRGAKKEEFAALKDYFRSPNPQAVLIFVADHLRIPADLRRMDLQDKERFERIRETLGDDCGVVELARVDEADAVRWLLATAESREMKFDPDAATMVLAAKQRSLYELTDAISARDKPRALALLHGLLNASDGGEDSAIGHLYMLARTFRQMLVILEKNVRDSRAIWQALWQGFRMPPFAAEDLIRQARRYGSRRELTGMLRLIAQADLELRSSPPDKRLVLERLVIELASEPRPRAAAIASAQYAMDL